MKSKNNKDKQFTGTAAQIKCGGGQSLRAWHQEGTRNREDYYGWGTIFWDIIKEPGKGPPESHAHGSLCPADHLPVDLEPVTLPCWNELLHLGEGMASCHGCPTLSQEQARGLGLEGMEGG